MSNPAGGPNNKPLQRISAKGGRVVREDDTVLNWADELWLQRYGVTLVNGKPSGTSFGADFVTATEKAELASKWEQGIPLKSITVDLQLTSRLLITPDEVTLQLETGIDPAAFGFVYSNARIRYEPGVPGYIKFTFASDDDNHNGDYDSAFGLLCPQCGYAIASRVVGGEKKLQFLLRNKGVDNYYDLNGDPFPEGQDVTDLNIYRIDYGFLGIDTTRLFVRDIANKKWVLLHEQTYPQRMTSINTPNLPIGAFVRNNGNTNNVKILNGSLQAGNVDGRIGLDPSAREKAYELTKTVVGATDGTVFAFRNDITMEGYDSIDSTGATTTRIFPNTIASLLKKVKGTSDGAQNVVVNLYITTIDNIISGTFTPVELGYSVLDISENAVIDLNAPETELLDSFPLAKVDSYRETVIGEGNLLRPGQVAIFTYTTQAGSDITWFIAFEDLF